MPGFSEPGSTYGFDNESTDRLLKSALTGSPSWASGTMTKEIVFNSSESDWGTSALAGKCPASPAIEGEVPAYRQAGRGTIGKQTTLGRRASQIQGSIETTYTEPEERLRFETLLAETSVRLVNLPADQIEGEIEGAQRRIPGSDHVGGSEWII